MADAQVIAQGATQNAHCVYRPRGYGAWRSSWVGQGASDLAGAGVGHLGVEVGGLDAGMPEQLMDEGHEGAAGRAVRER